MKLHQNWVALLVNIGYLFQRICIASSFLSLYMNTFYLTFVPAMVGVYVQLYKYSLFYMQASKRKQNILKTKCPSKWEGSDGIILINEISVTIFNSGKIGVEGRGGLIRLKRIKRYLNSFQWLSWQFLWSRKRDNHDKAIRKI